MQDESIRTAQTLSGGSAQSRTGNLKRFEVWAPNAEKVDLVLGNACYSMQKRSGSWWFADVAIWNGGIDYAIAVDGGQFLPDPRSPWQPHGVHGPSRTVDHSAFQWTDLHWQSRPLSSALLYELHVGTFTPEGTFDAAIEKLGYLADLGVTHIELMPVAEFSGSWGWGYDSVDLYAPHHSYGGPEGLRRLVNASHSHGLGVILDVVYNHFGPAGNYMDRLGPYQTTRYATPWGSAVNLDGSNSGEVRRFFIDNAKMWLRDYHVDGLRLDAVHALIDNGATHFLEQLALEVAELGAELGRHLFLIAESDQNDPRIVRTRELGGYGMDAQWSDDFHHALHSVLTGENGGYYADFGSLAQLAKAFKTPFVYDGVYSAFRSRAHGRPPRGLSGHRFLAYLQNHDQIGNRAAGDRIGHLVSSSRLKVGLGLVFTSPYVPMLFQGEEWSASTPFQYFTQHEDPELGLAVTKGRTNEFVAFGWDPDHVPDPQDQVTFQRSKLDWSELERDPHSDILHWVRELVRLRRDCRWISEGELDRVQVQFNEEAGWLAIERGPISIICNLGAEPQVLPVRPNAEVRLASEGDIKVSQSRMRLPPDSLAVLQHEEER